MGQNSRPQIRPKLNTKKISFPKGKNSEGTLYIEVYNGSHALEISYIQDIIIEKITTYFGYKAVHAVKIVQKPQSFIQDSQEQPFTNIPAPNIQQNLHISKLLKGIDDVEVKKSLTSLALAVSNS